MAVVEGIAELDTEADDAGADVAGAVLVWPEAVWADGVFAVEALLAEDVEHKALMWRVSEPLES